MTAEDAVRTFPNDPTPPPVLKAPKARVGEIAEPSVSIDVGPERRGAPSPADVVKPSKGVYRVIRQPSGGHRVIYIDEFENRSHVGNTPPDADTVLNEEGQYNKAGQLWDNVPETVALAMAKEGRLAPMEYWQKKWGRGEAVVLEGLNGWAALMRQMDFDTATERADAELLKNQIAEAPALAWNGGFGKLVADAVKSPLSTGRWTIGEAAGLAPYSMRSIGAGAKDAAVMGALTMGALAAGGTGIGTPAAAGMMAAALKWGGNFGAFRFVVQVESGSTALDLHRKGFEEKHIRIYAPLAGVLKGGLEMLGLKFMTASARRFVVNRVLDSAPVKRAMAKWYMAYAKELGGEILTEDAQTTVDSAVNNLVALLEKKPELAQSWDSFVQSIKDTTLATMAGAGVLMAPGAGVDALSARADVTAGEKAKAEETKVEAAETERISKVLEEREKKTETAEPAVVAPAATVEAPAATVEAPAATVETPISEPDTASLDNAIQQFDEGTITLEDLIGEMDDVLERDAETPVTTLEKRTAEVETRARIAKLDSDLRNVRTMISEFGKIRKQYLKEGTSVQILNTKIADLIAQETQLDKALALHLTAETKAKVAQGRLLEMRPEALEALLDLAFTTGAKTVNTERRAAIKAIIKEKKLTQIDAQKILRNKNIGLMGDVEFRNYLEEFTQKADLAVERKKAYREVQTMRHEKAIQQEQNIRRLHNLPSVPKMTTEQLKEFAKILSEYEKGDVALTPARIEALRTSEISGAKTLREALARGAEVLGVPIEELEDTHVGEYDPHRYDPQFARQSPLHNVVVTTVKAALIKSRVIKRALREQLYQLAAAAIASRPRSLTERMVPRQTKVMQFIEERNLEMKIALAEGLTFEELKWAEFWLEYAADAETYLILSKSLQTSRYSGGAYVPHILRSWGEVYQDEGIKGVVAEVKKRWQRQDERVPLSDSKGHIGLRGYMTQTEFRSGEMAPTHNIVKAMDAYIGSFEDKKAIDEFVPLLDTMVRALAERHKNADNAKIYDRVSNLVQAYLNAKKGNAAWIADQGGNTERVLRAVNTAVGMAYIAFNPVIQLVSPVGEAGAKFVALGTRGYALAKYRKRTPLGKAILAKYKGVVGEGPLEMMAQPGRDVSEQLAMLMYGVFKFIRKTTLEDVLLAGMTKEEFEAGSISPERVAQIELHAARWLDIEGMKSIRGSTVAGATLTKFRGWAIPPLMTTVGLANSLRHSMLRGDVSKRLTDTQFQELYRLTEVGVAGALLTTWAAAGDGGEDSFFLTVKKRIAMEALSPFQALSLVGWLTGGASVTFLAQFAANLALLAMLKRNERTDELTGWKGLKRQLPFSSAARQMSAATGLGEED